MTLSRDRASGRVRAFHVKDARGRPVTQLDPVAMYLLRQRGVINADVLRAVVGEKGVRITRWERIFLMVGIINVLLIICFFTHALFTGDIRSATMAKSASLLFACCVPWVIWHRIKRARWGNVASAMLRYLRCPHCGYDLRLLPVDPVDGATVCPECGCAWRLPAAAVRTTSEDVMCG